jgi:Ser/Thr protein kinase RdoA (MazF antagonist)
MTRLRPIAPAPLEALLTDARRITIQDDVVRRPRKPWSETVHHLLHHLGEHHLPVPRPLGLDDRYEYVSLVAGDDGDTAWPDGVSVEGARSMGALLRRVHDATRDVVLPGDAHWSVPWDPAPTICHGDPKPANMTWRDGMVVGLFDWDAARPGPASDDIAYALLWTVPIETDPSGAPLAARETELRQARAAALLDGYGWSSPLDVVDAAVARHALAVDEVQWLGVRGHEPHATWVDEGWPERWRSRLEAMRSAGRRTFPR